MHFLSSALGTNSFPLASEENRAMLQKFLAKKGQVRESEIPSYYMHIVVEGNSTSTVRSLINQTEVHKQFFCFSFCDF